MSIEVITREAACSKKLKKYFTGIPCKHGHICERWVCDATCFECKKIKVKKWQQKSKKQLAAYKREYRKQNLDKVRELEKKRYDREIDRLKRKKYSKAFDERRKLKQVALAGRDKPKACEICNESDVRICFDHCHKTGLFRGWLCVRCNSALGLVKDDIKLLMRLAAYLNQQRKGRELYCDKIDNERLLRKWYSIT